MKGKLMRSLSIVVVASCLVISTVMFTYAGAQDLTRAGRDVILTIKGTAVRLPGEGSDLEYVTFSDDLLRKTVTLNTVLSDLPAAEIFFAESEQILLSISNVTERGGFLLNRFPRQDFRTFSATVVFGRNARASCSAFEKEYRSFRVKSDQSMPGEDGWIRHQVSSRPWTSVFVRLSEDDQPRSMQGLTCDGFSVCSTTLCVSDNASFSFKFNVSAFPQVTWRTLGRNVDEMLQVLFPEK